MVSMSRLLLYSIAGRCDALPTVGIASNALTRVRDVCDKHRPVVYQIDRQDRFASRNSCSDVKVLLIGDMAQGSGLHFLPSTSPVAFDAMIIGAMAEREVRRGEIRKSYPKMS